jgi:hypothetical protein
VLRFAHRISQSALLPYLLILQKHTRSLRFRVHGNTQEAASERFGIQLRCSVCKITRTTYRDTQFRARTCVKCCLFLVHALP